MEINTKDIINTISLTGVVAGYKIEKREAKMMWDDERNGLKKGDTISQYVGYITVQTGENQFATVNVQKNENFFDGQPDYTTQALEAMSKEEVTTYYTTKDVTKTPTISVYRGVKIVDNYYVSNGELHETIRVDLGFGSISLREPSDDPKFVNTFNVSGVVQSVEPEETKDGEETGRAVLKLLVPYTYGSKDNQVVRCMKFEVVAGICEDEEGEYDLGQMLLDDADEVEGYSWQFVGELNGYYVEEEKPQEEGTRRGYGRRATVQTNRQRKFEYRLTGLDILQDGDAFSEEDIAEALQAREAHIAEMYKRDEERQQQPQEAKGGRGSFASGRTVGATTPKPAAGPATGPAAGGRTRTRNFK